MAQTKRIFTDLASVTVLRSHNGHRTLRTWPSVLKKCYVHWQAYMWGGENDYVLPFEHARSLATDSLAAKQGRF